MSVIVNKINKQIHQMILEAMGRAVADGALPEEACPAFSIEQPADSSHGDYACNVAMVSAKAFRKAPRMIAEAIVSRIDTHDTYIDRVEIAGPGFINFFTKPDCFADILLDVVERGGEYGHSDWGKGKKVNVEYVSANPTGPMHMGNARGGVLGDSLAAVLEAAGCDVFREFYINDAGNQIAKFGLSLDVRYKQLFLGEDAVELPEDAYHGKDIILRAKQFAKRYGDSFMNVSEEERRAALVEYALPLNIAKMKRDLKKYRVEYDLWFHESTLHESGKVADTIARLGELGLTYEKDGATWYKATEHSGEKDEVLIRANGTPTYFAADIAYHINKFERGSDICINVWGADHHGHVARMQGALDAVGMDGSKLEIVLMQLVNLMKDGKPVRMSKRTGKAIQLNDLLKMIPVDAARFFFNMRESTVKFDFDLGLAVKQDSQNPVYYVQYAHARICSIFRKYAEKGGSFSFADAQALKRLTAPEELELIRYIASYTDEIVIAAKEREPSRITRYVIDLATKYHKFYNACRVISDDEQLTAARLTLCWCARQVIANVLDMFRITAPEQMETIENEGN